MTTELSNEMHLIEKPYFNNGTYLSIRPNSLNELIELLYQAFSTEKVDIDYVYTIMNNYKGTHAEWAPYVRFQANRYTRNLVNAGNGKFNLLILCWAEGQGSSIHNHTDAHCFLKCLQGSITETKYAWPKPGIEEPMIIINRSDLCQGQVAYINDSLGLHRIENPSHTEPAVTLHLYTPPYDHCNIFDERTSRMVESKVTFYSPGRSLTSK